MTEQALSIQTPTFVETDRIGFAVIACGPYARTYKAETFVESLCRLGNWRGQVFVFTDEPRCFDLGRLQALSGNENISIAKVGGLQMKRGSPVSVSWRRWAGIPYPQLALKSSQTMSEAKSLKARLFEICPDENIQVLVYVDADTIVTRDLEMPQLMSLAQNWNGKEGIKCRLDAHDPKCPNTYTGCASIHSGLLVLHRNLSRRALARWLKELTNPTAWRRSPFDRDRYREAFDAVSASCADDNYMAIHVIPEETGIEGFSDLQHHHMIEHISFGRLRHHGYKDVEEYVSSSRTHHPNLLVVSLANRDWRPIWPQLPLQTQSRHQKVAATIPASPRNVGTFQTAASNVEKRREKVVGPAGLEPATRRL
jgi:hypothetical protein